MLNPPLDAFAVSVKAGAAPPATATPTATTRINHNALINDLRRLGTVALVVSQSDQPPLFAGTGSIQPLFEPGPSQAHEAEFNFASH